MQIIRGMKRAAIVRGVQAFGASRNDLTSPVVMQYDGEGQSTRFDIRGTCHAGRNPNRYDEF